jgi:hypothetical protein
MAHDLFYGYLSIKTFYDYIDNVAIAAFALGFSIGLIWKPGSIKI